MRKTSLEKRSTDELYSVVEHCRQTEFTSIVPSPRVQTNLQSKTVWASQGVAIHMLPEKANSLKVVCVLSVAYADPLGHVDTCDVAVITASPKRLNGVVQTMQQVGQKLAVLRVSGWLICGKVDIYKMTRLVLQSPLNEKYFALNDAYAAAVPGVIRSLYGLRSLLRRLTRVPEDPVVHAVNVKEKQVQQKPQLNWEQAFQETVARQQDRLMQTAETHQNQLIASRFKTMDALTWQLIMEQITAQEMQDKTLFELMQEHYERLTVDRS